MLLLKVRFDQITLPQILSKVATWFADSRSHTIFTPNPEMLVAAHSQSEFLSVLNSSDFNICDGVGAAWFLPGIQKIAGIDCLLEICGLCEKLGQSVFLLGSGKSAVVEKTASELKTQFPNLIIAGIDTGPRVNLVGMGESEMVIDKIILSGPAVLFVAFGQQKQEMWIKRHLAELPSVKLAMGVGGAFDFISGNISRAPCFWRQIGLEWLYRLFKQPRRFPRIFNATVRFLFLVWREKRLR